MRTFVAQLAIQTILEWGRVERWTLAHIVKKNMSSPRVDVSASCPVTDMTVALNMMEVGPTDRRFCAAALKATHWGRSL